MMVKIKTKVATRVVNIFELSHSHNSYEQTIIDSNLLVKTEKNEKKPSLLNDFVNA